MEDKEKFRRATVLLLVGAVSLVFVWMIRSFLVALLLAAIFSGMAMPIYRRLRDRIKSEGTAAVLTIVGLLILVGLPLAIFLGIVVAQAVEVSQTARPWIEAQIEQPRLIEEYVRNIPMIGSAIPSETDIAAKLGEFASTVGSFLADSVVDFTRGTANFFLMLFVMLYSMYFFLTAGRSILNRVLYYIPLPSEVELELVDKFVTVTRAVLKGSLVIGVIQGALAGASFWVAGVPGWAFWTAVMVVLSIVPAIGSALVWIPAVAYLAVSGQTAAAIGVGAWCGIVAGSVDNFLRPALVGKDTKLPDLLVLVGTLGGIFLFGAVGFILGPIVVALFLAVWELYGEVFEEWLPPAPDREPERLTESLATE
ncbi:MAG: AI-2E family transporter [Rhodothermales bacterium]|nr:AI-2E family transporter [Rhodothermales bacterium]MBO6778811.1 AI-2E family transporter [Rhodothermales bacterium]